MITSIRKIPSKKSRDQSPSSIGQRIAISLIFFCLVGCDASSSSVAYVVNDPPILSLNGITDCRYRHSNLFYADGREILQNCSTSPSGVSCAIAGIAPQPFENVKTVEEYQPVPHENNVFTISVTCSYTYSLSVKTAFLDEDGNPIENDADQWNRLDPIHQEFGYFYESPIENNRFSIAHEEGKSYYWVIYLQFWSDVYGSSDFLFFSRP